MVLNVLDFKRLGHIRQKASKLRAEPYSANKKAPEGWSPGQKGSEPVAVTHCELKMLGN